MKLAIALLASTSDFLRALTEETRCISRHHVQVPVAGLLGVLQHSMVGASPDMRIGDNACVDAHERRLTQDLNHK